MFQSLNPIKSILIAAVVSLVLVVPAQAVKPDEDSAVSKNFQTVGRSMRGVRDAKTSAELLEILQNIRAAVIANQSEVPSFMEAGSPQLQDYKDGVDDLLGRVDKAIALAEADDMQGAVAQMTVVRDARKEYHEKFEIESD